MGKGGTKFEGAAIGNRQSRGGGAVSGKEARKAMDTFKKTGKHPHLGGRDGEAADLAHAAELNVFDDAGKLPPRNAKRPHAFMSVQTAPDSVGADPVSPLPHPHANPTPTLTNPGELAYVFAHVSSRASSYLPPRRCPTNPPSRRPCILLRANPNLESGGWWWTVHMQFELFDDINPLAARSFRCGPLPSLPSPCRVASSR
jgi:hypothetical protein